MRNLYLLCALVPSLFAEATYAQSLIPESGNLGANCNFATGVMDFTCVPLYIGYLIQILLGFAGGFFLFGIMIAGYKYMFGSLTGQGTEKGKQEIIARVVGLVVILFAYLLVDTLITLLT